MSPEAIALTYRQPLKVVQMLLLENGDCFPVCPRCGITLEREYMSYCDRCGQCLEWKSYTKAILVRIKKIPEEERSSG